MHVTHDPTRPRFAAICEPCDWQGREYRDNLAALADWDRHIISARHARRMARQPRPVRVIPDESGCICGMVRDGVLAGGDCRAVGCADDCAACGHDGEAELEAERTGERIGG